MITGITEFIFTYMNYMCRCTVIRVRLIRVSLTLHRWHFKRCVGFSGIDLHESEKIVGFGGR